MKQLNKLLSAFSTKTLMLLSFFALLPTMASAQCPDDNHPHMIDLGLPSGTKWACCNVGAQKPEDYGGYFAWGETTEKSSYTEENYLDGKGINYDIGKDIAGTQYDAATVNWGTPWVMPSLEQMNELKNSCTSEWTTENGVNGRRFTSANGASIFLPAAGIHSSDELVSAGSFGGYWSSSLYESNTERACFLLDFGNVSVYSVNTNDRNRDCGQSVRPVVAGSSTPSGNIDFADPAVKAICVANWDTNGDGELSYEEAAKVTELGTVFMGNKEITTFVELQYFTGLTSIGENAFWGCEKLAGVIFPNGVTTIGDCAFRFCSSLTSLTLPNSLVTLGRRVFAECTSLASINIPISLTTLESGLFERCNSLSSIVIPKSVVSISPDTFKDCLSLKSIDVENCNSYFVSQKGVLFNKDMTRILCYPIGKANTSYSIPNTVNYIGSYSFFGCSNLVSLEIPNTVGFISDRAFTGCSGLTSLNLPNSVYSIGMWAFSDCSSLTSFTIPEKVTSIGDGTFYGCSSLTTVTIGSSILSINYEAFGNCPSLKEVRSYITEPFEINTDAFSNKNEVTHEDEFTTATLYVPAGCKSKYEATSGWNKFKNIVEMSSPSGIAIDETNFPDENFRNWVLAQDYGQDGVLTDAEIATVSIIAVGSKNISDLKGIEFFTALKYLYCEYNQLTSLDVSKNTLLIQLNCYGNQLTSLDFSKNVVLERLLCSSNQLTSLDVSQNKALNYLSCYYNQLTTLDVSQNKALTDLDCQENPLTSLDLSKNTALESLSFSEVLLSSIDLSHNTALTDLSFRNTPLTSIDLSNNRALTTLSCINNDQLTSLDVTKNAALTTLTCMGNDLFTSIDVTKNTALTRLYCDRNQLTSLDVSKNVALESLNCSGNQLTSLDVSKNTALTALNCGANPMTTIDVSKNVALNNLSCSDNQLTSLDVSKNIALTNLYCDNNQLSSLDVSKNTALIVLSCDGNQLSSLDVSKNTALIQFNCHDNQLTSLDLSQNASLQVLTCYYNQLRGTAMDALIESLPESEGYFYAFVPFDSKEQNVVTKAQVAAAKEKRWTTFYYDDSYGWKEYEGSEQGMEPIGNGETIDIGNEIDENTNLEGTVVDNVFVNISNGDGGFDPVEGCLIVSKPTDDSAINGKDIFGDDFKDNYTGIVFKVNEGKGSIKVEAETQGNMVLKVKIGNSDPIEMELDGKLKVKFPYNVSEETLVYIYGGLSDAGAKATGARRAPSATDLLKIYGFEIVSDPSGIDAIENGQQEDAPVYNLNGHRVNTPGKGVYIKNGRKVLVK